MASMSNGSLEASRRSAGEWGQNLSLSSCSYSLHADGRTSFKHSMPSSAGDDAVLTIPAVLQLASSFAPDLARVGPEESLPTASLQTAWRWLMYFFYLLYSLLTLAWEVGAGVLGIPIAIPEYKALEAQLAQAQSYAEWRAIGRMLDNLDGYGEWRLQELSPYFHFDGVMRCMEELAELRRSGNTAALIEVLLSRVQRSLYGINNTELYRYRTGTKNIIHSYTSLVCFLISGLASSVEGPPRSPQARLCAPDGPPAAPLAPATAQQCHDALAQMQVVYGSTALVLNGGMVVAPLHLGVVRALHAEGLLPRVIYGYRSGAIVAALACCRSDVGALDEHRLSFSALSGRAGEGGTVLRRWRRLWRDGHLMDSRVLSRFMRENVGDITFMEAYRRTGRVLNIQYTSFYRNPETGKMQRCSCLLNYLTTPNVLVHSAAVSSMASVPLMFQRVPLLARSMDGAIVEYDPAVLTQGYARTLSDDEGSAPRNSLHRLRELFHVQYFVVSECSTLLKPSFLQRQGQSTSGLLLLACLHACVTEFLRLLWWLLCATPLEPLLAPAMDNDIAECDITGDAMLVIPRLGWCDWLRLWTSSSPEEMRHCLVQGERQMWPRIEELRMSQTIECTIADTLARLCETHALSI